MSTTRWICVYCNKTLVGKDDFMECLKDRSGAYHGWRLIID